MEVSSFCWLLTITSFCKMKVCATNQDSIYIYWYLACIFYYIFKIFSRDCIEKCSSLGLQFFPDLCYLQCISTVLIAYKRLLKMRLAFFEKKLSERPECNFGVYDRDWCPGISIIYNKFYVEKKKNLEGFMVSYVMYI